MIGRVRRAPHGRREASSQHCEPATPGGLADMIGGALSVVPDDDKRTIPLYEEHLEIDKLQTVTDRVKVSTHVDERTVLLEDTVERGDLTIERIAVDRAVAQAPEPRQEGDTLIVSLVEERLVVEKRLFVIEELRITRTSTTEHVAIPQTVRTMRATVEHAKQSAATGE
ncbi:YsnF/AvaK domain-containing protein [Sphingomonas sp. PsM26]|nr:YsnF/AvaK domain-containing protein [Sphingomonas sp. PsM26]